MSGQKIGLTAGRGVAAAQGVAAAGASPESKQETTIKDNSKLETPQVHESENAMDKSSVGKDGHSEKLVNENKLDGGESDGGKIASGGGDDGGDPGNNSASTPSDVPWYRKGRWRAVVGTVVGAGVAVVAAPLAIGAVGFGAGGIVAGSFAAQMMSAAAVANGGAVAAGSLVATLQSIGAAGLGAAGLFGVGAAGAGVGATVGVGVGKVADLVTGNETEVTQETGESEGRPEEGKAGVATSEDVSKPLANLNLEAVDETERQPTEELLTIIVSESGGNIWKFSVMSSEPLQRMFEEYFTQTELARDSVIFEFNGLRLQGSESPAQLGIENDDVVKALQI